MAIKIKKQNRGKFTEYCGGKVTAECIRRGKNSPSAKIRKRAIFAANARKWQHAYGGYQMPPLLPYNDPITNYVDEYTGAAPASELSPSLNYYSILRDYENATPNIGLHYDDKLNPTIGYGHLLLPEERSSGYVSIGDSRVPINEFNKSHAYKLQKQDVKAAQERLSRQIGDAKMNQHMYDALVDIAYQQGSLKGKTLRNVKRGRYDKMIEDWEKVAEKSGHGRDLWRVNKMKYAANPLDSLSIKREYGWGGALQGAGQAAAMGATVGSAFPGLGTVIGAGVGAVVGGVSGHFMEEKRKKDEQEAIEAQLKGLQQPVQYNQGEQFTPVSRENGGAVPIVYSGQTHEGPAGGIAIDQNGNPNGANSTALVEDNEVSFLDDDKRRYIFSDNPELATKAGLPKGVTFAQIANKITNKYKNRKGDFLAESSQKKELKNLQQEQELARQSMAAEVMDNVSEYGCGGKINKFKCGGKMKKYRMGGYGDEDPKGWRANLLSGDNLMNYESVTPGVSRLSNFNWSFGRGRVGLPTGGGSSVIPELGAQNTPFSTEKAIFDITPRARQKEGWYGDYYNLPSMYRSTPSEPFVGPSAPDEMDFVGRQTERDYFRGLRKDMRAERQAARQAKTQGAGTGSTGRTKSGSAGGSAADYAGSIAMGASALGDIGAYFLTKPLKYDATKYMTRADITAPTLSAEYMKRTAEGQAATALRNIRGASPTLSAAGAIAAGDAASRSMGEASERIQNINAELKMRADLANQSIQQRNAQMQFMVDQENAANEEARRMYLERGLDKLAGTGMLYTQEREAARKRFQKTPTKRSSITRMEPEYDKTEVALPSDKELTPEPLTPRQVPSLDFFSRSDEGMSAEGAGGAYDVSQTSPEEITFGPEIPRVPEADKTRVAPYYTGAHEEALRRAGGGKERVKQNEERFLKSPYPRDILGRPITEEKAKEIRAAESYVTKMEAKHGKVEAAVRNNNPGNITRKKPDGTREFVQYESMEEGWDAMKRDVRKKVDSWSSKTSSPAMNAYYADNNKNRAEATISDLIHVYAPPTENDTVAYIKHIEKMAGINGHKLLANLTEQEVEKLVEAMIRFESGQAWEILYDKNS